MKSILTPSNCVVQDSRRQKAMRVMTTKQVLVGAAFVAALVTLGVAQSRLQKIVAQSGGAKQAPRFEVDPMWPKPLPNHWVLGSTIGVDVDANDNVWII